MKIRVVEKEYKKIWGVGKGGRKPGQIKKKWFFTDLSDSLTSNFVVFSV